VKYMYFFNKEERMYLNKGLIPESREMYIDQDLRGWNWQSPPLKPVYDFNLPVSEVASEFCPTFRDVYLKRVLNIEQEVNKYMVRGILLHKTMLDFITECKKTFYNQSVEKCNKTKLELTEGKMNSILDYQDMKIENREEIIEEIKLLWDFEMQRVIYRIQEILSRQPYIGIDALISQAIPVVVEQKLNGSFLGLSSHLSTDAVNFSETIILDIKFGQKRSFHRLNVTGYALTMEAIHSFPVNIGCLVYTSFKNGRIILDRDFFIIDDQLRQQFIENRDEKMRIIFEEDDPGVNENCQQFCSFRKDCV